jgi:hypothetical protein
MDYNWVYLTCMLVTIFFKYSHGLKKCSRSSLCELKVGCNWQKNCSHSKKMFTWYKIVRATQWWCHSMENWANFDLEKRNWWPAGNKIVVAAVFCVKILLWSIFVHLIVVDICLTRGRTRSAAAAEANLWRSLFVVQTDFFLGCLVIRSGLN